MEEDLGRVLSRALAIMVSHGQLNFGSALIIFLVIGGGFLALRYAIEEAEKGQPGCLMTSLGVGALLVAMFLCANA